ncbi:hypothetical protein BD410DRAFT_790904 [Rickenella mellea]|uniref:Uncharacterized protein n=1 Tax=Rickenella mellea TaxID=50990 RepID=A0A4Y7PYF2_9AGAM|nr:hypothetical protein BD410DRAFT_790904 [Rickenella mellea]
MSVENCRNGAENFHPGIPIPDVVDPYPCGGLSFCGETCFKECSVRVLLASYSGRSENQGMEESRLLCLDPQSCENELRSGDSDRNPGENQGHNFNFLIRPHIRSNRFKLGPSNSQRVSETDHLFISGGYVLLDEYTVSDRMIDMKTWCQLQKDITPARVRGISRAAGLKRRSRRGGPLLLRSSQKRFPTAV